MSADLEENLADSPGYKDLKLAGVLCKHLINDFTVAEKICSSEALQ